MLEPDRCYSALKSRDARFDGRFFFGVRTTGIYCRPVCPARTPKRVNVRFYACAAAAEQAGFRPCRRCRPETAPGTPAWQGTSATVSRALRLIDAGALDRGGVGELAARVGLGERQLRRLFLEHLGAGPKAVAATRRSHFARRLLDETALPMSEVAMAAGFASVRRFNAAMRDAFGCTPTELRRASRQKTSRGSRSRPSAPRDADGEGMAPARCELRLPFRRPYGWSLWARFMTPRALDPVESIRDGRYRRAFRFGAASGAVEVVCQPDEGVFRARVYTDDPGVLSPLAARLRRVLDLEAEPDVIASHLASDRRLAKIVRAHPGLRLTTAFDPFEAAVRAILGQQISVAGARTLALRLTLRHGEKAGDAAAELGLSHLFPTPEAVAEADLEALGVTRARARALRGLAEAVSGGEVVLDGSRAAEEVMEGLLALHGIGPWTAQVVAMRALGEPDAFPAGDLGLAKALARGDRTPSQRETLEIAERWRPWRAYATLYLWLSQSEGRKVG
jgi:AraC family transcriptional regulator of adaptative response / DNA-3-methyladenine glycosylase II